MAIQPNDPRFGGTPFPVGLSKIQALRNALAVAFNGQKEVVRPYTPKEAAAAESQDHLDVVTMDHSQVGTGSILTICHGLMVESFEYLNSTETFEVLRSADYFIRPSKFGWRIRYEAPFLKTQSAKAWFNTHRNPWNHSDKEVFPTMAAALAAIAQHINGSQVTRTKFAELRI